MYKNILLPVVFDEGHDTQAAFLAAKALANDGAKFTVLHVIEDIPAYAASQIPGNVLAATRGAVESAVRQLSAGLEGAEPVIANGHPGRSITDYADNHGIDCIVMASHRPGLQDYFLGSTADRVVRHAKCSVHVIR